MSEYFQYLGIHSTISKNGGSNENVKVRIRKLVVVVLGFTTLLTSQVISVAYYSEREKSDKFCSEALISA